MERRNLIEFRKKIGMTQKEMGKLFRLTESQWSRVESNDRKGNAVFWLSLQKKFNLTVDETLKLMEAA